MNGIQPPCVLYKRHSDGQAYGVRFLPHQWCEAIKEVRLMLNDVGDEGVRMMTDAILVIAQVHGLV